MFSIYIVAIYSESMCHTFNFLGCGVLFNRDNDITDKIQKFTIYVVQFKEILETEQK